MLVFHRKYFAAISRVRITYGNPSRYVVRGKLVELLLPSEFPQGHIQWKLIHHTFTGFPCSGESTRAAKLQYDVLHLLLIQRGFQEHASENSEMALVWIQIKSQEK